MERTTHVPEPRHDQEEAAERDTEANRDEREHVAGDDERAARVALDVEVATAGEEERDRSRDALEPGRGRDGAPLRGLPVRRILRGDRLFLDLALHLRHEASCGLQVSAANADHDVDRVAEMRHDAVDLEPWRGDRDACVLEHASHEPRAHGVGGAQELDLHVARFVGLHEAMVASMP